MTDHISGGEPVKKIISLTDADMDEIRALENVGFGRPGPAPDGGFNAIRSLRRKHGQTRGQRYLEWREMAIDAMRSHHPEARRRWHQANEAFLTTVTRGSPSVAQIHTDSALSDLTTQYANDEYIGDQLMPPVPVPLKSAVYYTYTKRDRFAQPNNDVIAADGEAPEIVESRGTGSYACQDRGYKNSIAANTVAAADAPLDELFDLTEALVEHRALARERRIATVLTSAGNYDAANIVTLAGANQWNAAGGGNPIANLQTADAALWRGSAVAQTKAFSSLDIFHVLSRHDDILGLFQYSGTAVGLATPTMIAKFLGWDDYLVGRARRDTAVEGDAVNYARIWGDFFGVLRVAQRQTLRSATFGFTARWTMPGVAGANQGILSQQWFDQTKGLGGSYFAKVGESEAHEVQANDTGYLISDVLA